MHKPYHNRHNAWDSPSGARKQLANQRVRIRPVKSEIFRGYGSQKLLNDDYDLIESSTDKRRFAFGAISLLGYLLSNSFSVFFALSISAN